jgi:hypothetical protein
VKDGASQASTDSELPTSMVERHAGCLERSDAESQQEDIACMAMHVHMCRLGY